MTTASDWRAGHRSLEARIRALPGLLRDGVARLHPPEPPLPRDARFVLTGVGSSAAHARYLAYLLRDAAGLDARVVPLSGFIQGPPHDSGDAVLIVVSQGLSPNARLALADHPSWRRVVLLTAATEEGARAAGDADKASLLAELRSAGVTIVPFPAGENEYETLVRVVGPVAGHVAALYLASAIAPDAMPTVDVDALCSSLETAPARLDSALGNFDVTCLSTGVSLLTSGVYGELVENLRYKFLEGMLLPAPPVWDLLDVAHGPLQHAHTGPMTLIALARPDASYDAELLARIERALDPERHTVLRLAATLPGALAIIDHEALVNSLMLRFIAAREVDQINWPGRGRDRELYDLGSLPEDVRGQRSGATRARGDSWRAGRSALTRPSPPRARVAPVSTAEVPARAGAHYSERVSRLDALTWPELAGLLALGPLTAVIPLGSTEQHGPHLPYGTDTWIADELAARFCARVPEAIRCPTVPIGCSSEHAAFPGTLDLRADTLRAVLGDVLLSLRGHGFEAAFIFSAHGGNYAALADALSALRAAAAPMRVIAYTDLAALTACFHRLSGEHGVSADASGHHAGEFETSIMRAIRPQSVRDDRIDAGLVGAHADPQALFYPSLRANAPSGVVGDPRSASAERAAHYLDGWVELLVAAYRRENASTYTKGT